MIDLVLGRPPVASAAWLDTQRAAQQVGISIITRIELLRKLVPAPELAFLQSFVQSVEVFPLDEPTVQRTIRLRQQHRVKLPDAIIAATALAHGLLTRNGSDFQATAGLAVVNPHEVARLP